jgi:lipoic acid synthetase/lipoate-protein ligase A
MKYITLPDTQAHRLSFYLAMEEYVARYSGEQDAFFMWQVEPTVVIGRNQSLQQEVDTDYCRQHGIAVYRRKSGGGCVYADHNNVMLSFVAQGDNVGFLYNRFMNMLLLVLRRMGVEATGTSHNDVLIGERKVSGTAVYHLPGHCIAHATLLYDTNMDHMLQAITPGAEKLRSKGIKSVDQRITLLKDHTRLSIDEVKACIRQTLCDGERPLAATDVATIEKIEQDYLQNSFINLIL